MSPILTIGSARSDAGEQGMKKAEKNYQNEDTPEK